MTFVPLLSAASILGALAILPASAAGVSVTPCAEGPRADAIAEPWEQNTATYAEGAVRLTAIDLVEPAGAPFYVMVMAPPLDELGLRGCHLVAQSEGTGFFGLDFSKRKAGYAAGRGLVVTMPIKQYDPAAGDGVPATLTLVIDQAAGKITASTAR